MSVAHAPPLPAIAPASRAAEDRYLREAFSANARTFALAARLLPRRVRLPVAVLYLYCRVVDEIADGRPVQTAADELDDTRRSLDATLAGSPPSEPFLWRRLAEIHSRFALPVAPFHELIDGAEWDLRGRPIENTGDLLAYSDLVAGSVGAMMLPLLVADPARRATLEAPARALGRAMQITNILRDVGEDLQRLGRVYLPSDGLARHGIERNDLDGRRARDPAYAALCEELMAIADILYAEAQAGIASLGWPQRTAVQSAARMYREILNEVRAAGYDNFTRRAVVSLPGKVLAVAGGYESRRARLIAARARGRG